MEEPLALGAPVTNCGLTPEADAVPRLDGLFPPVSHDEVLSCELAVARSSPVPASSLTCM